MGKKQVCLLLGLRFGNFVKGECMPPCVSERSRQWHLHTATGDWNTWDQNNQFCLFSLRWHWLVTGHIWSVYNQFWLCVPIEPGLCATLTYMWALLINVCVLTIRKSGEISWKNHLLKIIMALSRYHLNYWNKVYRILNLLSLTMAQRIKTLVHGIWPFDFIVVKQHRLRAKKYTVGEDDISSMSVKTSSLICWWKGNMYGNTSSSYANRNN